MAEIQECICDEHTLISAATHGNLEGMMWLKLNDCPWNEKPYYSAAQNGKMEPLEWLRVNGCPIVPAFYVPKCLEDFITVNFQSTKVCMATSI